VDGTAVTGLSVVCVYNDPAVRADCLDRSLAAYDGGLDIDYLPVDNTEHTFTSAGAALNHGARMARHDVVVFVHQDVWFHSLEQVAAKAAALHGDTWGMLGAVGVDSGGGVVGRMRDRVELIGRTAPTPVEVDSLDEVCFLIRRDRVLENPLSEDPDLAWHAYGVEYAVRMRSQGLGVGAVDLAVTHNSLTLNLARLDVAHRRVAALHPASVPVHTTCGTVGVRPDPTRTLPLLGKHRWRARWLLHSLTAARVRRSTGLPSVIADIRHEVDLLGFAPTAPLHVLNLDRTGVFARIDTAATTLVRIDKPVTMSTVATLDAVVAALDALPDDTSFLVTNLAPEDFAVLRRRCSRAATWLAGVQAGEPWLIGGPVATHPPRTWSAAPSAPFGGGALVPG
jgi:hypothetical protein